MATGTVHQLLTALAWAPVDGPATSEVSGVSIGVEVASGGSGAPPRNRDALKSASESQEKSAIREQAGPERHSERTATGTVAAQPVAQPVAARAGQRTQAAVDETGRHGQRYERGPESTGHG